MITHSISLSTARPGNSPAPTFTADGWLIVEVDGFARRFWLPALPQFLQNCGLSPATVPLQVRHYLLTRKIAAIIGLPVLVLLTDAEGKRAVAILANALGSDQCTALFHSMPQLLGVCHAEKLTAAPPPTEPRPTRPHAGPPVPDFLVLRLSKPALRVVGNLEN